MNDVVLIGRLVKDPELRFGTTGKAICNFTLAVDRPFAKQDPKADFFRVVVFGKTGENAANYLAKGRLVAVKGRIQNNNYEDQQGNKHYGTDIIADFVQFLERGNKQESPSSGAGFDEVPIEEDDDVPF